MPSSPQATLAAELAQLRDSYHDRLPQELAELITLARTLTDGPQSRPQLEGLLQRLHKLAGSGGTFGLDTLSQQASELERTIQTWLDSGGVIDSGTREHLLSAITAMVTTQRPSNALRPESPIYRAPPVCLDDGRAHISVWLVEDDAPLGEALGPLLAQFNYDVRLFSRVVDAEAAALTERPDILIMDVMFPDEDIDTTQALLESPTFRSLNCPVVFISAHEDFYSRVRAARLGAKGYLVKPLDVPRLAGLIERTMADRFADPFRVLIVDDDTAVLQHFKLVLTDAGMVVATLSEPEKIIDVVSEFHPELVLLDIHMPRYLGPELATVIRQYDDWIGLPIVFLSAETDRDKQLLAMSRGADDFLTKPITDPHLISAVRVRAARARLLNELISKDSLTGLLKHARIKEIIALEFDRGRRSAQALSVVMFDIDHFKVVNDTYGHAAGDRVIKTLANLLKQRLRQVDSIGRYGGEEFAAVLSQCDLETASQVLDEIRQSFAALSFESDGRAYSCTLSAGVACSTALPPSAGGSELLAAADQALYEAKRGGRNQVRQARATDRA